MKEKEMSEGSSSDDQKVIDLLRNHLDWSGEEFSSSEEKNMDAREGSIPQCESIKEFLDLLRETKEYRDSISERVKGSKEEDIEEEAKSVFETTDTFRSMVIDFGGDCLHLTYKPELYSLNFREAMDSYINVVEQSQAQRRTDKEEIERLDKERNWSHSNVARILEKEGLAGNSSVAKALVRLLLIDRELDYIANARESNIARYWGIKINARTGGFSSDTVITTRSKFFDRHPGNTIFVDKKQFFSPKSSYSFSDISE